MAKIKGTEFTTHCAAVMSRCLAEAGVQARTAEEVSLSVIDGLLHQFGGGYIYIPKGRADVGERAAEVHAMWSNGQTVPEIAKHFGYSEIWVYRLLSRERDRLSTLRRHRGPL